MMAIEFKIINPLLFKKWDELVISATMHSFFHSSSWARVLLESYKYEPKYFTLIDKNALLALLPLMEVKSRFTGKRGVSLPFSDHCDPIIEGSLNFGDLLYHVLEYGRNQNWKYFEVRGGNDYLQDVSPYMCFYKHTLDLTQDVDRVFSKFRDSTQRNIKKALKEGVRINICKSLESINEFYHLNCITRKMHGLPPQPYYFFKKIYDYIISRDFGIVVLASYKRRNIAGAVFFHIGEKVILKYAASDRKYQHLRPNNLVIWEAIKWYCTNGYKTFSFGRTEIENNGLRQFKRGWGTEENILKYFRFNTENGSVLKGELGKSRIGNRIFSNMPIALLKFIGSVSYRHMG